MSKIKTRIFVALIAVQVLFGFHYVASKVILRFFPAEVWASLRSILTAIIFVLIAFPLGKLHIRRGIQLLFPLFGFAILSTFLNQYLFLLGLQRTTPANSALLNTMIPVFTLVLVTLLGREKMTRARALGFMLSLGGVFFIHKIEDIRFSNATFVGDLFTLGNCFCYSIFLTFSRPFLQKHDRFWVTTWLFIYGSIGLSAVSLPSWQTFDWPTTVSPVVLGCMVYAIIGGTVLTYLLINYAIAEIESTTVAIFTYIQPVIACLAGWFWLGEKLSERTVIAGPIIFLGIYLVISGNSSKKNTRKLQHETLRVRA